MAVKCNCPGCNDKLCLHKVPIFSSLDHDELVKIRPMIHHREYKKGDTIIFEGDIIDSIVIINEGSVKAYKNTSDGREQILYVFSEGDFFGEQNLFGNQVSTYSVEALEKVKTCNLSREMFQKLLYTYPEISVKIIDELGNRISRLENALSIGVRNVDNRIGWILLEFADKYGTADEAGIIIHLPFSREGIANYLGIARETLSRKFSQLENEGLIKSLNNKEILIPDLGKIAEIAGNS
ncbi:CRP/FNR family transcriptional regulator [Herbinix hemicellulosilytica]|uniref:CRP/FNR family transcriptional regulator n=1 Tax=Herbinix hemicellulosilytica TaxID=1564487 RepID=A0A0H5SGN7_HERHM|nr:Crp/Fnr family transcriptional regulator [Herbinix hemicellulosilytica]RBP56817.1 CRP/FNR family transcriptional regulator [Herbinix hemicellulosilytica]CRZ34200.1 hypothetical protein HHT355_0997 [Herbinix hemicellulosilytica]